MNPVVRFFHQLLHPHCQHCMDSDNAKFDLELENKRCRSCESLERQLANANEQINKLTDKIGPQPIQMPVATEVAVKPLHRGAIPFSVIRQSLEMESRAKAGALKNAALPDKTNDKTKIDDGVGTVSNHIEELEQLVVNASVSRNAEIGTKQS